MHVTNEKEYSLGLLRVCIAFYSASISIENLHLKNPGLRIQLSYKPCYRLVRIGASTAKKRVQVLA